MKCAQNFDEQNFVIKKHKMVVLKTCENKMSGVKLIIVMFLRSYYLFISTIVLL